jgi:ubiquinone/menaquinone biosynthesis C-methylase UbiE
MARIDYNGPVADAYEAGRGAPPGGLDGWRDALAAYLPTDLPVLDLGAGTGLYSRLIHSWFGQAVVAVEPAIAMLRQSASNSPNGAIRHLVGRAEQLPLANGTIGAAWLSTMIHHIDDLSAAARELRRVLAPDAFVLIRATFPGLQSQIALYRFFPTAARIVDTFPTVAAVAEVFGQAGFAIESQTSVTQTNAASLREFHDKLRLRANTTLMALPDHEFAAGLEHLRQAVRDRDAADEPVVSQLELIVLR